MTDKEVAAILEQANGCVGEECPVDEVDQLLVLLKATERDLKSRMKDVVHMIDELDHLNAKEKRKPDEIKAFVKDIMSVFSHAVSHCICVVAASINSSTLTKCLS